LYTIKQIIPSQSSIGLRKKLYLSSVRSHLIYCSQVWWPCLLKDIKNLERVQRRATSFILQHSSLTYRERLITLELLPLSLWLELHDVLFLVKQMKNPSDNFNIFDHVGFVKSCTRSATKHHLIHNFTRTSAARHFYFNRVVRIWNHLPEICLDDSFAVIKHKVTKYFWTYFMTTFNSNDACSYHLCCPCPSCVYH